MSRVILEPSPTVRCGEKSAEKIPEVLQSLAGVPLPALQANELLYLNASHLMKFSPTKIGEQMLFSQRAVELARREFEVGQDFRLEIARPEVSQRDIKLGLTSSLIQRTEITLCHSLR